MGLVDTFSSKPSFSSLNHGGFINSTYHIGKCLIAGVDLQTLLCRTEYYLKVIERRNNTAGKLHLLMYRDTILTLIGKEGNTSFEVQGDDTNPGTAASVYYHRAIQLFWLGHSERCHYFIDKLFDAPFSGRGNQRTQILLYYGLISIKIMKKSSSYKMKAAPHYALKMLKTAAGFSQWNFCNKVT